MSSRKTFVGTFLCLGFLFQSAVAGLADGAAASFPPLKAQVKLVGGQDQVSTYQAFVQAGTNNFAFLVPPGFGFKADSANGEELVFVGSDYSSGISIRVVSMLTKEKASGDLSQLRQDWTEKHAEGKVLNAFLQPIAGVRCPLLDVDWKEARGVRRQGTIVQVPVRNLLIEVTFSSSVAAFAEGRSAFADLLTSLRVGDEEGKVSLPIYRKNI